MNKTEFDQLCQECCELIHNGKKIAAIKLWRQKTGQGLQAAKSNMDIIEGEGRVDALAQVDPILLQGYKNFVQSKLIGMDSLTVLDAMEYIPTLKEHLASELDRWYIIYLANLKTSVFKKTRTRVSGEDEPNIDGVDFGFNIKTKGDAGWLAEIASDYEAVIKKISMHCQMLQMMTSADFPGEKVE